MNRKMGPATRDAFGETLLALGEEDERIVVVDGDVADSTRTKKFFEKYPHRAWNVGIAESNLVGIGAGLAASGKLPLIASFACFLMCNAYDQIRMSIAFPALNAKLVGSHGGISPGEDGPSQMAVEDLALACGLGGFTVVVPSDGPSAEVLTRAMFELEGPVYMRTGRPEVPIIHEDASSIELGKAAKIRDGSDVSIIANGLLVTEALDAAESLETEGISASVIDLHTVKPLDTETILSEAAKTGRILVAEEHFERGGLGSAVAMTVAQNHPVPMAFINVGDAYSTSGKPDELFKASGITADNIVEAVRRMA